MSATTCDACARPVADNAHLCAACTDRLARDLCAIPSLAVELVTTRLRQSRTGGAATGVLSRAYERPLPWNDHAADVADALRATVVGWVRVVVEERGGAWPEDTMPALAAHLLVAVEWLRHHPDAAEAADEIGDAVKRAYRAVDNAPGRLYIGPCDPRAEFGESVCPTDLYAREGSLESTCPTCDLIWNVENRRAYLVGQAGDQLVTAADLSRFLSIYGEPLTAERIRKWSSRGLLKAHGKTPDGRATYRVDEVTALLVTMGQQRDTPTSGVA